MKSDLSNGVMLNVYPDSIGERLDGTVTLLQHPALHDVFSTLYVLPSCFHSDLDRGFSIVDYDLEADLVTTDDLAALERLGIALKFDLVLNHLSVGSPQFRDMVARGDESEYRDFFIDWDEFWTGYGTRSDEGHVVPDPEHLDRLFMRKPGLPILSVRFPDGTDRNYWNTFYQQVSNGPDGRGYLGQMDVNAESEAVWAFYRETIAKLSGYGAKILRLDAFAYLHKEVGKSNFFNRPGTWDHLERLRVIASDFDLTLLPEIHSEYGSGLHEELSDHGYPVYDFFFPGLVIDAIDSADGSHLVRWIGEIVERDLKVVNMLGCHDGIPVIDLRGGVDADGRARPGLLPDSTIEATVERLVERGGRVKNLYGPDGTKISYYQVNATFFSALGEDEQRLRLARAIQVFMPGTPEVWYLDLFAGKNDDLAADAAGEGGHKEINRTNLTMAEVEAWLEWPIVVDQLAMLRLRNTSPAFDGTLEVGPTASDHLLLTWTGDGAVAVLDADLSSGAFTITDRRGAEETALHFA